MPVSPEVSALAPMIAKAFARGRIVPFLGRGGGFAYGVDSPIGGELADQLAIHASYPPDWERSLTRASRDMLTRQGSGPLYSKRQGVFTAALTPNPLHALLASVTLRQKTPPATIPHQTLLSQPR